MSSSLHATTSRQRSASQHPSTSCDPSSITTSEDLIDVLEIDATLCARGSQLGLQYHWKKYLAVQAALAKMNTMVSDGTWKGKPATKRDIIEVFISSSYFFSHHEKLFQPLIKDTRKYPILRKWLEGGEDAPSDLEAWGLEKRLYKFQDMIIFNSNKGTLNPDLQMDKDKGGGKGKGKSKGKGKEKEKEEEEEEEEKTKKSKRKNRK